MNKGKGTRIKKILKRHWLDAIAVSVPILVFVLAFIKEIPTAISLPLMLAFWWLLVLRSPSWIINRLSKKLGMSKPEESRFSERLEHLNELKCFGLERGGEFIGYAERSLIYIGFLILYYPYLSAQHRPDFSSFLQPLMTLLMAILTGKGILRFAGEVRGNEEEKSHAELKSFERARACAEWYMLGTFISISLGLLLSWILFEVILPCICIN